MEKKISECVEMLKDVRRSMHGVTDPSTAMALDCVILRLEGYSNAGHVEEAGLEHAVAEALNIISVILSCCTSIANLMGRF